MAFKQERKRTHKVQRKSEMTQKQGEREIPEAIKDTKQQKKKKKRRKQKSEAKKQQLEGQTTQQDSDAVPSSTLAQQKPSAQPVVETVTTETTDKQLITSQDLDSAASLRFANKRTYLCVGINEVTRALERYNPHQAAVPEPSNSSNAQTATPSTGSASSLPLSVVLVCKEAQPTRLIQHIPYLCYIKVCLQ
jgi:hypothetical protein